MLYNRLFWLPAMVVIGALTCSCSDPHSTAGPEDEARSPETQGVEIADKAVAADASAAPVAETAQSRDPEPDGKVTEIDWDALIPADYSPEKILAKYDLDSLSDDDPRADELQRELRELWDKAPVRDELDGKRVKLPGFVVPVEADSEESTGFLLVPYYGACIHVPPPPANQTVYVLTEQGKGAKPKVFDVVWVTGDLSVHRIDNEMAEAGYTLYATDVEPYE